MTREKQIEICKKIIKAEGDCIKVCLRDEDLYCEGCVLYKECNKPMLERAQKKLEELEREGSMQETDKTSKYGLNDVCEICGKIYIDHTDNCHYCPSATTRFNPKQDPKPGQFGRFWDYSKANAIYGYLQELYKDRDFPYQILSPICGSEDSFAHFEPLTEPDWQQLEKKVVKKWFVKSAKDLVKTLVDGGWVPAENGNFRKEDKLEFLNSMWKLCGKEAELPRAFGHYPNVGVYEFLEDWLECREVEE